MMKFPRSLTTSRAGRLHRLLLICGRMAEAPNDHRGREGTTAACIAKIKLHIRKSRDSNRGG